LLGQLLSIGHIHAIDVARNHEIHIIVKLARLCWHDQHINDGSVTAPSPSFLRNRTTAADRRHQFLKGLCGLGWVQELRIATDGFFGRISEHLLGTAIPTDDSTIKVLTDDRIARKPNDGGQVLKEKMEMMEPKERKYYQAM
jgi:hypothetical protein